MIVGIPKEIKDNEYRVAITPGGVHELALYGHEVLVEKGAGLGSGFFDEEYRQAGARLVEKAEEVYRNAEIIVKVKEPIEPEYDLLQVGQILFTYLHLAAAPSLFDVLLKKEIAAIAYETVEDRQGGLPLLAPMSEIAGRMAVLVGSQYLQKPYQGRGLLTGGVPGVLPASVTILGGGNVGTNAAKMAVGLGADVTILDVSLNRLRYLDDVFNNRIKTLYSNSFNIREQVAKADLLIGAVLIPGAKAPRLVTRDMLSRMQPGAVIVDVAVDQGGCVETIKATTHSQPTYMVEGVVHYGVANMPGAVPRTSTFALTNATLPYLVKLTNWGFKEAVAADPGLARGVNTFAGKVTHQAVAECFQRDYQPLPFAEVA